MVNTSFPELWLATMSCQIKFLELPAQDSLDDHAPVGFEIDDVGFQASFAKLKTTTRSVPKPFEEIADPKQYLVQQLNSTDKMILGLAFAKQTDLASVLRTYGVDIPQ